jgi:hypothetical protein
MENVNLRVSSQPDVTRPTKPTDQTQQPIMPTNAFAGIESELGPWILLLLFLACSAIPIYSRESSRILEPHSVLTRWLPIPYGSP